MRYQAWKSWHHCCSHHQRSLQQHVVKWMGWVGCRRVTILQLVLQGCALLADKAFLPSTYWLANLLVISRTFAQLVLQDHFTYKDQCSRNHFAIKSEKLLEISAAKTKHSWNQRYKSYKPSWKQCYKSLTILEAVLQITNLLGSSATKKKLLASSATKKKPSCK